MVQKPEEGQNFGPAFLMFFVDRLGCLFNCEDHFHVHIFTAIQTMRHFIYFHSRPELMCRSGLKCPSPKYFYFLI